MRMSANDGGGEGTFMSGSERNAWAMNQLFLLIPSRNVFFRTDTDTSSGGGAIQGRGGKGVNDLGGVDVLVLTRDLYQFVVVSVDVPIVVTDSLSADCDE